MPDFEDEIEPLLVEVRASTRGFAQDIAGMRGVIDGGLVDGFSRAGDVLERGLLGAVRRGSLGFDDLRRVALNTLNEIAAHAVQGLFGSSGTSGIGGLLNLGGLVGSVLGLPGRATGGPVAPGRGYLVGERGPELFVPASAGRVEAIERSAGRPEPALGSRPILPAAQIQRPRDVRVAINVVTPQGMGAPQSLRRSTRQIASAVRRAMAGD